MQPNKRPFSTVKSAREEDYANLPVTALKYEVIDWSSHSADYHPRNIKENKPTEQSSRWSSERSNKQQFVTLKLNKPAILHSITFGKYYKVHVCNLKEYKIYGGMKPNSMIELLHSGLRNDDKSETFLIKRKIKDDVDLPCQYIKIVPLMAWGANFNFSVWFVQLNGVDNSSIVSNCLDSYNEFHNYETIRLCLKHFRQRGYDHVFEALKDATSISLENKQLTCLHKNLVLEGNFEECEKIIEWAHHEDIYREYVRQCNYEPKWTQISPVDRNNAITLDKPTKRGGHQLCLDPNTDTIYLFGGWDGERDLNDLWNYDIKTNIWTRISHNTCTKGGPGGRSCHKMCIDIHGQHIYVLGRYVEPSERRASLGGKLASDFYRYNIKDDTWTKISCDTESEGGPSLMYDHQMAIDTNDKFIVIFGGRKVTSDDTHAYSGLYLYFYETNTWNFLRDDEESCKDRIPLKSRIGHSILYDSIRKRVYIFAGQRNGEYLSDFLVFDLNNNCITEMNLDTAKQGGPSATFTQRATIDEETGEIYILSGLMRGKFAKRETVKNSLWQYNTNDHLWSKIFENEKIQSSIYNLKNDTEPCPRYAHQFIFHPRTKVHYLLGGNPGFLKNSSFRLDDFWTLNLWRPTPKFIANKAIFMLRQQKFKEMCHVDKVAALEYLRTKVGEIVDRSDKTQVQQFNLLSSYLFTIPPVNKSQDGEVIVIKNSKRMDAVKNERVQLYENILLYFPTSMKQPEENLIDLIMNADKGQAPNNNNQHGGNGGVSGSSISNNKLSSNSDMLSQSRGSRSSVGNNGNPSYVPGPNNIENYYQPIQRTNYYSSSSSSSSQQQQNRSGRSNSYSFSIDRNNSSSSQTRPGDNAGSSGGGVVIATVDRDFNEFVNNHNHNGVTTINVRHSNRNYGGLSNNNNNTSTSSNIRVQSSAGSGLNPSEDTVNNFDAEDGMNGNEDSV